jgi:hypothetical protein
MKLTKSGLDTMAAGPSAWFAGNVYIDVVSVPGAGHEGHGRDRALHAGRPHGVAHPPEGPDDLCHRGGRPNSARGRARFHAQLAYQEADDSGEHTTWGRHLTDEEYPA